MVLIRNYKLPFHLISVPGIVIVTAMPGLATVYLSVEQAQQVIFPGETFELVSLHLSEEKESILKKRLGKTVHGIKQKIWKTQSGHYFFVDQVIGKHDIITYAVGIHTDGTIQQVEIMEYREAYGGEIRHKRWRRQFEGKAGDAPLALNQDIKNISGATLSCRHVTEGVKRILDFYDIALRK